MASATERLVGLIGAKDRYDTPAADLLPEQVAAADERLQSRIESRPLSAPSLRPLDGGRRH